MPTYFAGWIFGNGGIRFGNGFTVTRMGVGSYRIQIGAIPSGRFLAPLVSPAAANTVARIVSYSKSAVDGSSTINIEVRDATGALVDGDFTFIAVERS